MNKTINDRIKMLIQSLGLKNIEFAQAINIKPSSVSRIAAGQRNASDRTILDICRVYSVNEEWLRNGKGEMFVKKTREEEIGAFLGEVISGDDIFKKAFLSTLAQLSDDGWKALEDIAFGIVKKHKEIEEEM